MRRRQRIQLRDWHTWSAHQWRLLWEYNWSDQNPDDHRTGAQQILAAYYQTELWDVNRQPAIVRAKGKCENCHRAPVDVVHHLPIGYKHLFFEAPEDLLAVCRPCHDFFHGFNPDDPADWRKVEQQQFWREGEAL